MTRTELACLQLRLSLLIEQLQRGPKFTRLPPAHYWHNHVNELKPQQKVGRKGVPNYNGAARFTVSRRKWMLDPQVEHVPMPVPLRMPELPYQYCAPSAPLKRTAMALKILNEIEKAGGDICGVLHPKQNNYYCALLDGHDGLHQYEKIEALHKSMQS